VITLVPESAPERAPPRPTDWFKAILRPSSVCLLD